jgi:hypothetical protein
MRFRGAIAPALLSVTCLATASLAQAADPLAGLELTEKRIGWDGVGLGMSKVQAENRFGLPLSLMEKPRARCGRFVVAAEREGQVLEVGFTDARPAAKIEDLNVRFEGEQAQAGMADLLASLLKIAPDATYVPDPQFPEQTEATDPAPVYRIVRRKQSLAVQLRPGDGVRVTASDCLR